MALVKSRMRARWCAPTLLFLPITCSAQTTHKAIGKCPIGAATEACKSFLELRKVRDPKLESALKEDSFVCFEPKRDEFYVVFFTFPSDLEFMESMDPKPKPGPYDGVGSLEIRDYRSGVFASEGRSRIIFGVWSKPGTNYEFSSSGVPANAEPPSSSASVDGEVVTVKQESKSTDGEQTYFSLMIQRSINRFELSYRYALKDGRQDNEAVQGRCLSFKRQ